MKTYQISALKQKLTELYNEVYNVGIIDQNFINNQNLLKKGTLKILKNNIGNEIQISTLYSLKSAYNEIHSKLDEVSNLHPEWKPFLDDFQSENYLACNLVFDQIKNKQIESKVLENLSTNHGIVQEGERIVSQGDIVSSNTFSILESLRSIFEKNRGENSKYILSVLGRAIFDFHPSIDPLSVFAQYPQKINEVKAGYFFYPDYPDRDDRLLRLCHQIRII